MANEGNLTPFPPGKSGNPKGKPPGTRNRSTIANKWLSTEQSIKNPLTGIIETLTQEDIGTLNLINLMRKQNPTAISAYNALMDSAHGRPISTTNMTLEIPSEEDLTPEEYRQAIEIVRQKRSELETSRHYKPSDDSGNPDE